MRSELLYQDPGHHENQGNGGRSLISGRIISDQSGYQAFYSKTIIKPLNSNLKQLDLLRLVADVYC